MSYQQVIDLHEKGISSSNIALLLQMAEKDVKLFSANYDLEQRMAALGADRFLDRQQNLKDKGKAHETSALMDFIFKHIKPAAEAIAKWMEENPRTKETRCLKEIDLHSAALMGIRAILSYNHRKDLIKFTTLCSSVMKYCGTDINSDIESATKAGRVVLDCVIDASGGFFTKVKRPNDTPPHHLVYVIEVTDEFYAWEDEHTKELAELMVIYRPMVVPPKPWTGVRNGGYYSENLTQPFVRNLRKLPVSKFGANAIPKMYESINRIQATPFSINEFVLDTALALKELGVKHKEFLQDEPEKPHNHFPSDLRKSIEDAQEKLGLTRDAYEGITGEMKKKDRPTFSKWIRSCLEKLVDPETARIKEGLEKDRFELVQYMKWRKKLTSIRSKNRVINTALETAIEYREFPEHYYPHNCCWRGRAYPICSGLSTQGVGLQKALIKFAEGFALNAKGDENGERALHFLKIHVANSYGLDKKPLKERVKWVDENHEIILKTANRPLDCYDEWLDTDEPWLFLAACKVYADVITSGLCAVSDIPLPMDGTCNGAQHYAAMSRDLKGAHGVNVLPNGTLGLQERLTELRSKIG